MNRVLSYNMHKGFSLRRKYVLDSIKKVIQATEVDIVFLQEVLGENTKLSKIHKNWPMETQLEYLADSVWPHYAYGKNAVYEHGHHGNAILSRFPILEFENIDISNNRFERRGLLHAVIQTPKIQRLHLICVHLDLFEKGRRTQAGQIVKRIRAHVPENEPLILAGDFNDWSEKISNIFLQDLQLREAFHHLYGKHALSFPSVLPLLPLDRIYFRGLQMRQAKCFTGAPWSQLSDHGALIAEFTAEEKGASDLG